MRTVCGWGRQVQQALRRPRAGTPFASVRPLGGGRSALLIDRPGVQMRGGARLDQVDGTTCGSAVLVALAAWADPREMQKLDATVADAAGGEMPGGVTAGFGSRYDARQKQVHRESTRFWPQAWGTTPWGMTGWLRRHAPGAGRYEVRLVDDTSAADVAAVLGRVRVALAAGRPVPLLVGPFVPRHYCLALSDRSAAAGNAAAGHDAPAGDAGQDAEVWRVYEPSSGEVRIVPVALVGRAALAPLLGFDHLHAVLLPA